MPRRYALLALAALVLAFAACGGGAPEPTATVVPRPTLPAPPPQLREDTEGPTPLALGPRYEEATLALLPDAEPFGVRDVVEAIDASASFTVHRFVSAGSPFPVVIGLCSPRAPDGVVLQTQHTSGAVSTLFVWAYPDVSTIGDDWVTVDGLFGPRPPRPLSVSGSPTTTASPQAATEPPDAPDAGAVQPPDTGESCTTTASATADMIAALQRDNLVIVLTTAAPHPGTIHTSSGANEELLDLLRNLDVTP